MANIPLQSITFPGLSDKYTTPTVDATLTQTGAAADAKKTGDEIGAIKNDLSDGTFIVNNAENAEQLTSTVGIEDTTPYLFRTSGGSNDIGDREDVKKIVGGTIVNNQLVQKRNSPTVTDGDKSIAINDGKVNITVNGTSGNPISSVDWIVLYPSHKYLVLVDIPFNVGYQIYFQEYTSSWTGYGVIINYTGEVGQNTLRVYVGSSIAVGTYEIHPTVTDLTQMLGTSIADYVYNLETATAGAGVAWLKKHFPKQFDSGYQAYDAGSLQSVSGLTEHKMVGFNQWDEEWELGVYDTNTGAPASVNTNIRSKSTNYIPVVPGTVYYFNTAGKLMEVYQYRADKSYIGKFNVTDNTATLDVACCFLRFDVGSSYGTTYNHDICINLHWDGEKDGQYEPYKEYTYALDSSLTLRGIPKVDASGNLYYDGDEYLPDGTVNRRYGIVDLGTLTWTFNNEEYNIFRCVPPNIARVIEPPYSNRQSGAICTKYSASTAFVISSQMSDKSWLRTGVEFFIRDSSYTDVVAFKAAMSGVMLVYELATPTTETALPYQETQIVDDFGTEEFVLADGAFPVPVGHNTMYQNNLRAKLEMSPDSPDGDGLYVVQQESGENTYVPLASTATIQDILTRLTALENA